MSDDTRKPAPRPGAQPGVRTQEDREDRNMPAPPARTIATENQETREGGKE